MSNYDHDSIVSHARNMQAEIVRLESKVGELSQSFGTLQPTAVPPIANLSNQRADERWSEAERLYEQSKAICEANDAAHAKNDLLVRKLVAVIEGAGLKSHTLRRKGRGYFKTETVSADWLSNLRSALPANRYSVAWLHGVWEGMRKYHADQEAIRAQQHQDREREREDAEGARLQKITAAVGASILGVIGQPKSASELLRAIRTKDKYLDLAIAMLETRCDWSDGFYRVGDALDRFTPESARDREIVASVSRALQSGESDGRIFRDLGEWSYDGIFALADPKLREIYDQIVAVE